MDNLNPDLLETKVAGIATSHQSVTGPAEGIMQVFEAFKEANDQRLEQLESRLSADVITLDKVNRLNQALDEQKSRLDHMTLKANRPALTNRSERSNHMESGLHRQAFENYVRKGDANGLAELEAKSLSAGSNPDGGYVVPDETEAAIGSLLAGVSPIRAIADVRQVSSAVYKKPFAISGPASGWVGETAARMETTSPVLEELSFPAMELYAMPAATQSLLDDAAVDIDRWIGEEVQSAFAEQESSAFVNGNGINQPSGFMTAPTVDDDNWSWGNIGYRTTGVAGGFAGVNASDDLIDLVYALKSSYRQNAHWVMNRRTQGEIRKLKDADGNYLWRPAATALDKATLMNFPIAEVEDMPDIAADSFAVALGDFSKGYLIVDRLGVRVLRDPFSSKPYVLFYTTKRVGGGVQNFEAIKFLKFATA